MAAQYNEIQELLRKRADLHARLNLMPYDGTPEIKDRGDGKYLYIRKRVAGKQTSTYVGAYTDDLYKRGMPQRRRSCRTAPAPPASAPRPAPGGSGCRTPAARSH